MNKIIYAIVAILTCTSCTQSYNIQGTSNIALLDGRMLYLKTMHDGELNTIDSCEVVHGQFKFSGPMDTASIATIYMDDESVIPVVIEEGDITIQLNNTKQVCTGTDLNDKLFEFIEQYNKLQSRFNDISHRENQGIMDGADMDSIYKVLTADVEKIAIEEDKLITGFICDNFDNVLGPGVFMMVTSGYRYPMLTPWIEDIMSKATDVFKNNAYVKEYMSAAERNQNINNGMETPAVAPVAPVTGTPKVGGTLPPTPAEMAQPSEE